MNAGLRIRFAQLALKSTEKGAGRMAGFSGGRVGR